MNDAIKCDVKSCMHNADGCNCRLESIKVTCGCGEHKTCCGDYTEEVF